MKISESTKRKINNFIIYCFLFFVFIIILMIMLPEIVTGPDARKRADLQVRIRFVQTAIEDHKKITGEYPESIEELIDSGLLDRPMPDNPFSKNNESLQEIQLDEEASFGDISYISFKTDETIDKYTLIAYGSIIQVLDIDLDGQDDNIMIICEEDYVNVAEQLKIFQLRRRKTYMEWFCEK